MPIRTAPSVSPGSRTHSCSAVYFKSSGYTALLRPVPGRLRPGACSRTLLLLRRLREARGLDLVRRGHLHLVELLHPGPPAALFDLVDETAAEGHRGGEGVRLADRVHDVRRLQGHPVHEEPVGLTVGDPGAGDHPHLAVDLDGLGAGA